MSMMRIAGGSCLKGKVKVGGSKNAALPILAAALLNGGVSVIENCPYLADVVAMIEILQYIGCKVEYDDHCAIIDSGGLTDWILPDKLFKELRSSIVLLGPMLARMGKARFTYPGGCDIGKRPIDLHLKGLKMLGAHIDERDGHLICSADKLVGNHIILGYPSVGATENIMLAAVMARGKTIITNAAREPEIWDLQCFINKMGGKVSGAGTSIITIEGVDRLHAVHHSIIPDRIVAGTYMAASAITGGDIVLDNINTGHMVAIIDKYKDMGCDILSDGNSLRVKGPRCIYPVDITTLPYPGFPTDMQAITMAVLTKADGISRIVETVFENRFRHVNDLIAMGADIMLCDKTAIIKGARELKGAEVKAKDLRGGAALIIAALVARGVTLIDDIYFVDRGYEGMCDVLNNLGADVSIVS